MCQIPTHIDKTWLMPRGITVEECTSSVWYVAFYNRDLCRAPGDYFWVVTHCLSSVRRCYKELQELILISSESFSRVKQYHPQLYPSLYLTLLLCYWFYSKANCVDPRWVLAASVAAYILINIQTEREYSLFSKLKMSRHWISRCFIGLT